jgi:octaprenyl-diphosphate synthase
MDNEYTQRLEKIEAELNRWLLSPALWLENEKVINSLSLDALFTPLKDILSRGGKRWRPLLMMLVCETLGGGDSALPLVPLVEFCHNASLIHDDIEDDSDQRRGKPAIHEIYGIDTAVNCGAFFYFLSAACIESWQEKNKEAVYKLWTSYMRKLHLGQAMDINWHREITLIPGIEEYYTMCGMKTGCLASFAAELGAYCAGAGSHAGAYDEAARLAGLAAEKLGIGFQILDDVKNLTTGVPGKRRGDDVVEGKKSLPVILFMNKFPEKRERIFYFFHQAKTYGASVPEVGEFIETLEQAGIFKEAEEKGQSLIKEARDIFNSAQYAGIGASSEGRRLLDGLIGLIS